MKTKIKKEFELNKIEKILLNKPVIGVANLCNIPGAQLNKIRQKLRDKIDIIVVKNKLLSIALDKAEEKRKNIHLLKNAIICQTALFASGINAFKLFREIENTKMKVPAKGGEFAEEDITINAGDTDFKPGPMITNLQKVNIPAAIEKGKIVIKKDTVVVKAKEKICKELADVLTQFGIYPLTAGLDVQAIYENNIVFNRVVLDINLEKIKNDISSAHENSIKLALEIEHITKYTLPILLQRGYNSAFSLSIHTNIPTKETIKYMLMKAYMHAYTLHSKTKK